MAHVRLALFLAGFAAVAFSCSSTAVLPSYARPGSGDGFHQVADGQYFNGQRDEHFWFYAGTGSALGTAQTIRTRLRDNGWITGPLGTTVDPAAFAARRNDRCFVYGDLKSGLPGWIDILKDEEPNAYGAAIASESAMYIATGCS